MPVPHRLWWRVTDILPLAAHAAATTRHAPIPGRQPAPVYPALVWTSGPDGDWLSSNGIPAWHAADGTGHRVRAETWSHPATGTTGNPAQTDPTDGLLPLLAEHLDGRRTLLDLLEFARRHQVHWFGLHPDPATTATNTRYLIAEHRGDLVPPDATWVPATVTSAAVDGRTYPALIADGYTALDGVLARFPPDSLPTLIEQQREAFLDDDTGTVVHLRQAGGLLIVERQEYDDDTGLRWVEEDRCHPDADGCYLVGAYQWHWTLA